MNENTENMDQTNGMNPKSNNMMYIIGAVVVVIVIAGIAFAMKGSGNSLPEINEGSQNEEMSDVAKGSDSTIEDSSTSADVVMDSNAKQINLEAGSFYFKPNVLTVKKGQKVQIIMKSVDMLHNFNIDELNVHGEMVKSGETKVIEFTPEKTGTFEYYCSVSDHRAKGQVGKITVTE